MAVAALLGNLAGCGTNRPADLVLLNGAIHARAGDTVSVEALAVRDGLIVYAGSSAGAEASIGEGTRVIDLAGKMVLPGFHDTHMHPRGGLGLAEPRLDDLESREAILDSVRRYAAGHPELAWIRGRGWQLPVFPGANPRKEWLDSVAGDRPVYLSAADGHSAWVNSRALALAGITRETPDPPNGRIERDPRTGEPSGTLRESATGLVARHLPRRTTREIEAGLRRALAMANGFGITSLYDADADPELLAGYAALDSAGLLTARVIAALSTDPRAGPLQVDSLRAWRGRYAGTRYFSPRAAKIFVDGVIEAGTAALLAPYQGGTGSGEPTLSPGALDTLVAALDAAGFQVHTHAIGDRAVRMSLDAFAFARRHNGPRDARPMIAHLELIDSADIARFAAQGVVPSFQPLWAYADSYIRDLTEPVLGPARSRWLYPIASVSRAGAPLAAGSDWPVSSMNPLLAVQVAITRRPPDTTTGPAWLPEQRVTLATILTAYSEGGAWAAGEESRTGTLEVGKAADLIVLDRNLYRIPPVEIHSVKVLLTLLDGREVWRDPAMR
jgi:predicted amidohydrolase YtcJ